MLVKVDFNLSHRYGVVERILFRLVLNGFENLQDIYDALPLFSDSVIANAVVHLVNRQILSLDGETRALSLSKAIRALIVACNRNEYDIDYANTVEPISVLFDDASKEGIHNKELILKQLLPGFDVGYLSRDIDFVVSQKVGDI